MFVYVNDIVLIVIDKRDRFCSRELCPERRYLPALSHFYEVQLNNSRMLIISTIAGVVLITTEGKNTIVFLTLNCRLADRQLLINEK